MALPEVAYAALIRQTPHIRIVSKESKVIRLVQWSGEKRLKIA
jgi:hypothetical protein